MKRPDSQRLEHLARKWLEGTITPEEQEEFAHWYNQNQDEPVTVPPSIAEYEAAHRERLLADIQSRLHRKPYRVGWLRFAAAVALIVASFATVLLVRRQADTTSIQPTTDLGEALPGGDRAFLTFDDGSSVSLHEQQNGVLQNERGVRIRKENGMVVYEPLPTDAGTVQYNTITTPRGGQFALRLPDGSTVWLNSASSLRYPTRFSEASRTVELTGEAFFEVVPVSEKSGQNAVPFLVHVEKKQTVKVLGTKFNINGYEDETAVKTTLVEGSVEIADNRGARAMLKPNQQATLVRNGSLTVTDHANVEEAMAWKNGQLVFRDTDIKEIMRQIARWYDVEVEYQDDIPERLFNGEMSRGTKLSSLLQILETSGVRFRQDGKKLIVTL